MGCTSSKSVAVVAPAPKTPVLVEPPAEEIKKVEQEVKTAQVAAIIAEIPQEAKDIWKNKRAQKKFKALDADGSGKLEANELNALAEWVWGSFNPKQTITDAARREWATKIKDACDKNDDGVIDKEEFEVYYVNVCKEMNDHHKDRIAKERAAKLAAADNALQKQATMDNMAKQAKIEKRLDKEANDVLPISDSKMKSVRKSKDITLYANLMMELIFECDQAADGMDHSDLFDFAGVPHRTTVYELKEMFASKVENCEAWQMGECKFYSKRGKMQTAENHERLFEGGITDGVKIQMVKDDDLTKPEPNAPIPEVVVLPPVNERAVEQLKTKAMWMEKHRNNGQCVHKSIVETADDYVSRGQPLCDQIDVSKDRLLDFFENTLKWTEEDLKMPWEKKRYLMYGHGNPSKYKEFKEGFSDSNGYRIMTNFLHGQDGPQAGGDGMEESRKSKVFIMQIGYWNEEERLQFPYAMIGALRGLHILKDEGDLKEWMEMEVDEAKGIE